LSQGAAQNSTVNHGLAIVRGGLSSWALAQKESLEVSAEQTEVFNFDKFKQPAADFGEH